MRRVMVALMAVILGFGLVRADSGTTTTAVRGAVRTSALSASAWDRPQLVNPVPAMLSEATRYQLGHLDASTDYDITCRNPVMLTTGIVIYGGHNVLLHDCDLQIGSGGSASFKNQTGTIWVNGVHFTGTALTEGIDLQEPNPGVTVVLRDVLVDELHGSKSTHHADVIQTWCGPARLLVDGLTAKSDYQGFFLLPNQNGGCASAVEGIWDFRHVDLTVGGGYSNWLGWVGADAKGSVDLNVQDFYVSAPRTNPGGQWRDVQAGSPPGGPYVTATADGAQGPDEPGSSPHANGAGVNPPAYAAER